MLVLLLTILITAGAGYLIIKKFQTHAVLFLAGLMLIGLAALNGNQNILPEGVKSTGWIGFDLFEVIKSIMSGRVGKIGLIIMAAGGFAKYMGHIGAASTMVRLAVKPLEKLNNPYLVLALAYLVGQMQHLFIPSAAGLAMLLLISMFPILIRLGITPISAAAVIGTSAGFALGPATGTTNVAAKTAGIDVAVYFAKFQIPGAVIAIFVVAVLHFFVQRYFDRRDAENGVIAKEVSFVKDSGKKAPAIYALLPMLPLILLLVFSKLVITSINLSVVTAMLISLFVSMIFEFFRTKDLRSTLGDIKVFFNGMGNMFASIVTLIFAAETFATGLKTVGFIDQLIQSAGNLGLPPFAMLLVMVLIIGVTAMITGSGISAFFSFASLAPEVAKGLGLAAVVLLLPMQLSSGMFRAMSPVAGVIIAVAGAAEVSSFAIVRRTAIPMTGGIIVMLLCSWFLI